MFRSHDSDVLLLSGAEDLVPCDVSIQGCTMCIKIAVVVSGMVAVGHVVNCGAPQQPIQIAVSQDPQQELRDQGRVESVEDCDITGTAVSRMSR